MRNVLATSQRPIVVLGPLWEFVVEKLISDFPNEFTRVTPELIQVTPTNQAQVQAKYLELKKRGSYSECISIQSIKDICDKVCFLV